MRDQLNFLKEIAARLKRLPFGFARNGVFLFAAVTGTVALASTSTPITYQARILKPNGDPLESLVTMQFTIRAPNGCILWSENQTINMAGSKGAVSTEVGGLSAVNLAAGTHGFSSIFLNDKAITGLSGCAIGSTYTPTAIDDRTLTVTFNDGTGVNNLPALSIRSVPFSHFAQVSKSVLQLIGVDISETAPTNGQVLQFNSGSSKWEPASVGTGSVTNVGLSGGAIFNVTGGPVTTAGTFNLAFANQGQNLILASPDGSTGVPTFRAMVAADVPNLPAGKITSGTLSAAVGGTGLVPVVGDANKIYGVNAAGTGTEFKSLNPGTGITIDQSVPGVVTITANNSGSVTHVGTGTGLTGGPINGVGTISLANTTVTAGSFGTPTSVPTFIVDAQGRLTGAGSLAIALNASQITSGTLNTAQLGVIDGSLLTNISAGSITSGTINQAQLGTYLGNINASQVATGTLSQAVLGTYLGSFGGPFTGTIGASQVTAGTFDTARLGTFDASLTTTGTFALARLGTIPFTLLSGTAAIAQLGAIPFTSLNGTISTAQLGLIDGSSITSISGSSITSGTINQAQLGTYLGSVAASQVNSGTLAQAQLGAYLGNVDASQVATGTLSQAVLGTYLGSFGGPFTGTIAASQVTAGTFDTARLGTFDASLTTTGTFALARLGLVPFAQLFGTISTAQLGLIDGSSITSISGSSITSGTINQAQLGTYLGSVAASQVNSGTLAQAQLGTYLGGLNGSQLTAGTIDIARLGSIPFTSLNGTISTAQLGLIDGSSITSISGSSITSGTINQAQLGTYLGSVAASQVNSGTLAQAQLGTYLGNIDASQVATGTLSQAVLGTYLGSFGGPFTGTVGASQVTAGTFDTARLGTFDASLTTTGTFALARLGTMPFTLLSGTAAIAQLGAIPFTSLNGTISTAQLGLIDGSSITSISGSSITSGTINQAQLGTYLGSVAASQVNSGTLAQAQLGTYLGNIDASQVATGTLSQAVLGTYLGSFGGPFTGTIAASQVTAGTFDTARLGTFDASLTATGTFALARLGTMPFTSLSGTAAIAQLGAIPFTSLAGTISTAQLGLIDGSSLTNIAGSSITSGTINQAQLGTYLGSVAASQVNSGTLAQAQLGTYLGGLNGSQLTAGTIDTARLGAIPFTSLNGTISTAQLGLIDGSSLTNIAGSSITSGTISQAALGTYLGNIDASQVATGTLSQAVLGTYLGSFGGAFTGTIAASQVTSGTLDSARLGTFDASMTTTGTFAAARLGTYVGTLDAAQITTGTLSQAVLGTFTGNYSGTISASQVASGTLATARLGAIPNSITTGTSANTANTLVLRDGTGGFAAGTVSVATQVFAGTGAATVFAPTAGNYSLTLPTHAGTLGQVLTTSGTTGILSWTTVSSGGGGSNDGWAGSTVATAEARNSTSFGDLTTAGPAVTLTTGNTAAVTLTALMTTSTASRTCAMSFSINGAAVSDDTKALMVRLTATSDTNRFSATFNVTGLTPGSNTFTAKYRDVTSANACTFADRNIVVVATVPPACTDTTPDGFALNNLTNQTTSTLVTSNIIQVNGISCAVPVAVSGQGSPQFRICNDSGCSDLAQDWTSAAANISNGQYIQARVTTVAQSGATMNLGIGIGSVASIWSVATTGGNCADPSPPIGTVCADGTIYAGLSPDGNVKMFTTRCDAGQSWDGATCTGARASIPYSSSYGGYWLSASSNITGKAQTVEAANTVNSVSPYQAAQYCSGLSAGSKTDWYVGATSELQVLYANRDYIGNFDTSGSYYWSSTHGTGFGDYEGRVVRFSNGNVTDYGKEISHYVRCVRKDLACTDSTPAGFSFSNLINQTASSTVTSTPVQLNSFNCAVATSISGAGSPEYQVCANASCSSVVQDWTSGASTVEPYQYIRIRLTSGAAETTRSATMTAGGVNANWSVSTAGNCSGLPGSPPPIGTVCTDGTIYAGLSPDGSVPMFTTRCNVGQTWNGVTCTGAAFESQFAGGAGFNLAHAGLRSSTTGQSNSAAWAALSDGGAPYDAALLCENLSSDGHTDWYLPALNELTVLYGSRSEIGNFLNTSNGNYWSSTEAWNHTAKTKDFENGSTNDWDKDNLWPQVRCVRR